MADKKEKAVVADLKSALPVAMWVLKVLITVIVIYGVSKWFREKSVVFPQAYVPQYGMITNMHQTRFPISKLHWMEQVIPFDAQYLDFDILHAGVVYEVMYNNDERNIHKGWLGKKVPLDTPTRSVKIKIAEDQNADFAEISMRIGIATKALLR